jgi:hypothetical protein
MSFINIKQVIDIHNKDDFNNYIKTIHNNFEKILQDKCESKLNYLFPVSIKMFDYYTQEDIFWKVFIYDYKQVHFDMFKLLIDYLFETHNHIFKYIQIKYIEYINNETNKNYIKNYVYEDYTLQELIEKYNFPNIAFTNEEQDLLSEIDKWSFQSHGPMGEGLLPNNLITEETNYVDTIDMLYNSPSILNIKVKYLSFTIDPLPSGKFDKIQPLRYIFEKYYSGILKCNYFKIDIFEIIENNCLYFKLITKETFEEVEETDVDDYDFSEGDKKNREDEEYNNIVSSITTELLEEGVEYMKKNNLIINCITYKFNNKDTEQKKIYCLDEFELIKIPEQCSEKLLDYICDKNIDIKFELNNIMKSCSCFGLSIYIYKLIKHIQNIFSYEK